MAAIRARSKRGGEQVFVVSCNEVQAEIERRKSEGYIIIEVIYL